MLLADLPDLIQGGQRVLGEERFQQYMELSASPQEPFPVRRADGSGRDGGGSEAPETFVLIRGSAHAKGPKVEPGFPEVLGGSTPAIPEPPPGQNERTPHRAGQLGRLARQPAHFPRDGQPAVAVPLRPRDCPLPRIISAFRATPRRTRSCSTGLPASSARGWSMKAMHRLIMTSSTYRMAATGSDPNALAADPRNDLMWRFDLRRLTAESARLDPGVKRDAEPEGVRPECLPANPQGGAGWATSARQGVGHERSRRFGQAERLRARQAVAPPADPRKLRRRRARHDLPGAVRDGAADPALGTLNSEFMNQEAQNAQRLKREAGDDLRKQVAHGLRLTTCRTPTDREVAGVELVERCGRKMVRRRTWP